MTERKAFKLFVQEVLPLVEKKEQKNGGKKDKPMRGQAWVQFIDMLQKDGVITEKQAYSWGNPYYE